MPSPFEPPTTFRQRHPDVYLEKPYPRPFLYLTPGDPLGIGPEITARYLQQHAILHPQQPVWVIGAMDALVAAAQKLGLTLPEESDDLIYEQIAGSLPGEIAYNAVERAVHRIACDEGGGLVTGPIAKENLAAAGLPASGHTELLELWAKQYFPGQPAQAEMLFLYRQFRLLLLTRHIPLAAVSDTLKTMDIAASLRILAHFLRDTVGIATPQLALLGVNPHAGEVGGDEERVALLPAMAQLHAEGIARCDGPFPADAYFRGFNADAPPHDAIVAMYHDQGLIPFKLLAGYAAVNCTIGLPFIRTSVGHGTAFDIAGQGIAREDSLVAAIDAAVNLLPAKRNA